MDCSLQVNNNEVRTMLKRLPQKANLLAITLALSSTSALAGPLGSAGMFNVYASGNIDYGQVDVEGVVGAGGNISFTNGGLIGNQIGNGNTTSVYSGGSFTFGHPGQGGTIYKGVQAGSNVALSNTGIGGDIASKGDVTVYQGSKSVPSMNITSEGSTTLTSFGFNNSSVHVGGNFDNEGGGNFTGSTLVKGPGATTTADGWYLNQGSVTNGDAPNVELFDHNQAAADIASASQAYAAMSANGTVANPYAEQWVFSGNSDLNIFNVDGSDLAHLASLTFEGDMNSTYVINVAGVNIDFGSLGDKIGGFFSDAGKMAVDVNIFDEFSGKILFNFFEATDLDLYGSIFGSVLAPNADVWVQGGGDGGALNGSLWANSISGYGQINNIGFTGSGPSASVPGPATLPLMIAGLAGLFWQARRKAA